MAVICSKDYEEGGSGCVYHEVMRLHQLLLPPLHSHGAGVQYKHKLCIVNNVQCGFFIYCTI